jgi:Icc-related predicted phosphoesterase
MEKSSVKITCLSDTHGQHNSKKLNKWLAENSGDILIFAGDLQLNQYDDGKNFLSWMNDLSYKYKLMTFGNHDCNFQIIIDESKKYKNLFVLNHEFINIEGINIFGSPYSLPFLNWWFMKTESELGELYKLIPDNTNILFTHGCPFGILDKTEGGVLTGSKSLLNRIKELKDLKYCISGHIHEQYGKVKYDNVEFINASLLEEKYRLINTPIIIDYVS